MSKPTKGPYTAAKDHRIYSGHTPIAQVLASSRPLEQKANEQLFAASWELAEALQRLDTFWANPQHGDFRTPESAKSVSCLSDETISIWKQIRAALGKAGLA